MSEPIRAELIGAHAARAEGILVTSESPVLALCQALVEAGHPSATPLEAYRDNVLSLSVRSIGEGAGLRVTTAPEGRPIFSKKRPETYAGASQTRLIEGPGLVPPETPENAPARPDRSERLRLMKMEARRDRAHRRQYR